MFAYKWQTNYDSSPHSSPRIRIYGINDDLENVCLNVLHFHPFAYVQVVLPSADHPIFSAVVRRLKNFSTDIISVSRVTDRKTLYPSSSDLFLLVVAENRSALGRLKELTYRPVCLPECLPAKRSVVCHLWEDRISYDVQMSALRHLPVVGWISFFDGAQEITAPRDRQTRCVREYDVDWRKIEAWTDRENTPSPPPLLASFDFEVFSEQEASMPADRMGDVVFQISLVFYREGHCHHSVLLTLGRDVKCGEGIEVECCPDEETLLVRFLDWLDLFRPNVITGYNILRFDLPYFCKRAARHFLTEKMRRSVGYHRYLPALEKNLKWSSSAYKNQAFFYVDWEGVLLLDMLPVIQREYKLDNYRLETVASHFLQRGKDPVTPSDIFRAYASMDVQRLSVVGEYCVKDSQLVLDLISHLHTWVALVEMAKVCHVDLFSLYAKGQQIKVFNHVYQYCSRRHIVVNPPCRARKGDHEGFIGAHVIRPVPGYYEDVCPLDFSSLYPSIIIAYNICYSTRVKDDDPVSDDRCHVLAWEDHVECEHDPKIIQIQSLSQKIQSKETECSEWKKTASPSRKQVETFKDRHIRPLREARQALQKTRNKKKKVCASRRFRFIKADTGVLPAIVQNLIDGRRTVKERMKDNALSVDDRLLLHHQQLAFKVSANSVYGTMGGQNSMLPFLEGAMCVTHLGRTAIEKVERLLKEKWEGRVVYGDTDSNYVQFPHLAGSSASEIWDHAIRVACDVSSHFMAPMKLEFERVIYRKFIILSKKNYLYHSSDRDGSVKSVGQKGVVTARRDNAKLLRRIYGRVVQMLFDDHTQQEIEDYVVEEVQRLFAWGSVPLDEFVITKSVGDFNADAALTEDGKKGDYKMRRTLPQDPTERLRVLAGMTEKAFYTDQCPAHTRLAEVMKDRGQTVDSGSRLEYVVVAPNSLKPMAVTAKEKQHLEHVDYFKKWRRYVPLNVGYYLKSLILPLQQLMAAARPDSDRDFMKKLYQMCVYREKMLQSLRWRVAKKCSA